MISRALRLSSVAAALLAACNGFGSRLPAAYEGSPTWEDGISAFMATYCDSCHGPTPAAGAPSYIRTDVYADTAEYNGAASMADRHLARMRDAGDPMPPIGYLMPTPDEIAFFERWVELGAPETLADIALQCDPGEVVPCACAGGVWGAQVCLADGSFDVCDCGGGTDTGFADTTEATYEPGSLDELAITIFEPGCMGRNCHSTGRAYPDLTYNDGLRDRLLALGRQTDEPLVVPGDPMSSYLYRKCLPELVGDPSMDGELMPIDAPLSDGELELLRAWIANGAL